MFPIALTLMLGLGFVAAAIFAYLARRGWRAFWAALATVIFLVAVFLMWPGSYLNLFWFPRPVGHAVEVTPFADWPHQNGRNAVEVIQAPADGYVLVQYGYEARTPKEVPGCGIALVPPGMSATLTVWDGNAETLRGTAAAVHEYARSELLARQANETRCQVWTIIGLEDYTSTATEALAFSAPDVSGDSTSPCGAEYVVQPGDGRLRIAQRCERTWSEIAVENSLPDDYALHPGATLRIP